MALKLHKFRSGEGFERDIGMAAWNAFKNDEPIGEAVKGELVDLAIQRYSGNIAAMLRKGGFDVEDGAELTAESITALVSQRTGLDLSDLSEDGIKRAVDKLASERLSAYLGITVTTVLDVDSLKQQIEDAVAESISNGTALKLISRQIRSRASTAATFTRAGYSQEDRRKLFMQIAQTKWRRLNKLVWE